MLADTILIIIAFGAGAFVGWLLSKAKRERLREIIALKDQSIAGLTEDRASLQSDHSELGQQHGELGKRFTEAERALGRARAEIERLKPDAEYGRDIRAKQKKASAAGVAARAARAAQAAQPTGTRITPPRQRVKTKPAQKAAAK